VDTARTHYGRALELAPRSAEVQNYVGEFFARQRDVESALERFRVAANLALEMEDENEKVAGFHYNLARILAVTKRAAEARSSFRTAIQLDPQHALAHTGLARLLQDENRWAESMRHLEQALATEPDTAPAHVYLGVALVEQRELARAAGHFEKALRVDPQSIDARAHLANVLAAQGKLAAAVPLYRELLRAHPESDAIALKLAWCLATCRDEELRSGTEAVQLAQRVADAADVKEPAVLDVLAAAHAEAGDFEKALDIIADAEELAKDRPEWIRLLNERRELYENRQPLRAGLER
jgi:tetratricopeptide (TPR) repeat protein